MKLLYDASALLNTIRLHGRDAYELLKSHLVLSLTKYEIGNALWREVSLLKRINSEEALEVIALIDDVLKVMGVVDPLDSALVFKLACKLQITYYEASYVTASIENDAKLITDDAKLMRKMQDGMETSTKVLGKKPNVLSCAEVRRIPCKGSSHL